MSTDFPATYAGIHIMVIICILTRTLFQGLNCGSHSDSDTAALVDMDLHTQMSPGDSELGFDNVGLDFTDLDFIMDENSQKILNGDYTFYEFRG